MTPGERPGRRGLRSPSPTWTQQADVVVVGTGAAGLSTALAAAAGGRQVLVVTKSQLGAGCTPLAQGGLAAVTTTGDRLEDHAADTLVAGAGLCDPRAVAALVAGAPGAIAHLTGLGATWDPGSPGLEGGHRTPRILHAGGDATGAEVHRVLAAAVAAASGIRVLERTVALDALLDRHGHLGGLIAGRYGPDDPHLQPGELRAGAVVLATGGFGQAWATTTNPAGQTGDGLALAARAGAELADLEFVQFHPTVLWQPDAQGHQPLVTEALRGAGAVLVDVHGRSVMAGRHPWGDLAPRDVVAAAMQERMAAGDGPTTHLWLDARRVGARRLQEEFPTVRAACRAIGIDPATAPIPVAPGAHYACGGVWSDMEGKTSLDGLYAVGEVAATGAHGANRLASNSLTEALVTGRRLGRALASRPLPTAADDVVRPTSGWGTTARRETAAGWETTAAGKGAAAGEAGGAHPSARLATARAMSAHAGILRTAEGLEHLLQQLAAVPPAAMTGDQLDLATVEATNLHVVSTLVALAALRRGESRGCHRRRDRPGSDDAWARRTVIRVGAGQAELRLAELTRDSSPAAVEVPA